MIYTVTWTKHAVNQLAFYWHCTKNKRGITLASDTIDRDLKNDPEKKAVAFDEFFVNCVSPLAVLLRISPDDRIVEVVEVAPYE